MEEKKEEKKGKINKSILNTYSIEEISEIFTDIDKKIISLHQCSSDDFLTLNSHFKNYYRESKTISGNAAQIFDIILGKNNNGYYQELKVYHNKFNNLTNSFEGQIEKSSGLVCTILSKMNKLFVPLNNYKQNIMTLNFLITNLRLNVAYANSENGNSISKNSKNIEQCIQSLKLRLNEFDQGLNRLKTLLKKAGNKLEDIKNNNLQNIQQFLDRIDSSIELLTKKHKEATKQIPFLTEKTESSSKSIANIITNLQYQDIIRQKIEHIQHTHQDVIRELNTSEKSLKNQDTELSRKAKTFLKIRDIAGLQAAQLLHANKQYQAAIENITGRFLEIGNDMSTISNLCHQLSFQTDESGSTHFKEIQKNLIEAGNLSKLFSQTNIEFKSYIDTINTEFSNMGGLYKEMYSDYSDLTKFTNQILTDYVNYEAYEPKTFEQIKNLWGDILNTVVQVRSLLKETNLAKIDLVNYATNYSSENKIIKSLSDFHKNTPIVLKTLHENNEKVQQLLNENKELSTTISEDIKSSIKNVKYYDFFEKVIDKIINELNNINLQLKSSESVFKLSKEDNLKHLKERYTMESEHLIHDHISTLEQRGVVDIFESNNIKSVDAKKIEEDDDNLELF